jgi:hypothetical protein
MQRAKTITFPFSYFEGAMKNATKAVEREGTNCILTGLARTNRKEEGGKTQRTS